MEFTKKDNLKELQGVDLVFTRYLYIKEEVRIALLVSILNKSDDAIFWAYELYYSGFKEEFFNLIWKIYHDFFATLNPAFEVYLLKKHKEWLKTNGENDDSQDKLVSSIIQDLLFRPFNTDVFILRNLCDNFEIDIIYHHDTEIITHTIDANTNLTQWVAQVILGLSNQEIENILDYFCRQSEHQKIYFLWRPHLPDPKDDHLLELAIASGTKLIVTHHTKDFKGVDEFGIRSITPKKLLEEIL